MPKSYATIAQDIAKGLEAFGQAAPETLQNFMALAKGVNKDGALSELEKELIALAIGVTSRCDGCIAFHTKALVRLGATRAQVAEALSVCTYMGGGPTLMYVADAMRAFEELSAGR
jgi:AhpD family alkylhydroperoxidase